MHNYSNAFCVAVAIWSASAIAAVSPDEARQLAGNTLTGFGAEKAASSDGSIPAYTGGLQTPPAGYKAGSTVYIDPFADEKSIMTIDAKNMGQYEANLTPGTVAMMKKYPDFHIDVYPSHRTAAYPDWVLKNTLKNATNAELTGKIEGDGVKGAYGGVPFPIPKNGYEVMWNFYLHWMTPGHFVRNDSYLVSASGTRTLLGTFAGTYANSYYDPNASKLDDPYFLKQLDVGIAPSSQVGYNLLLSFSIDYSRADVLNWLYTPGQRRVRTAPEFTYDTPASNFSGALTYDEVNVASGRLDRFDFKLVGKKEVYVPYNVYKPYLPPATTDTVLTGKFPNPNFIRYEKHRVWVVEATLKPGQRHIMSKKVFFVDEDTWLIDEVDEYDHGGQLYRIGVDYPFAIYDKEAPFTEGEVYAFFDLNRGSYFIGIPIGSGYVTTASKLPDMSQFTPGRLAAMGVR